MFSGQNEMAPKVGLEPTTDRLTADCSTIELLWMPVGLAIYKPPIMASTGFGQLFSHSACNSLQSTVYTWIIQGGWRKPMGAGNPAFRFDRGKAMIASQQSRNFQAYAERRSEMSERL
jgi:hypothetical protein